MVKLADKYDVTFRIASDGSRFIDASAAQIKPRSFEFVSDFEHEYYD
jgi:hypothetical protein